MFRKSLLKLGVCLSFMIIIGGLFVQGTAHAKNTSVHVHIQGEVDQVASVSIIHKGTEIPLEQKSTKLYSVKKPADIVKPDISDIIVTKTDGSVHVYSPAIDYAGVEGKGTINYWIEVTESSESGSQEDGTTSDSTDMTDTSESTDSTDTTDTSKSSDTTTTTNTSNPTNSSTTEGESEATTATTTPTTVTGGKLPATSTPWYNALLVSGLLAIGSGGAFLLLKRPAK